MPDLALSVVCPVYDEAENIVRTVDSLAEKVKVPLELVIVYDKDDDTTLPVLERVKARLPYQLRTVKNAYGRGAANAIKTGFGAARAESVLVVMADLSDDLSVVPRMLELSQAGAEVVCGSRYMRGGRQIGGPFLKKTLSRLAGVSLHYLRGLPTHDATNSFKLYRRELLRRVTVESDAGFELGLELTVKAWRSGGRIAEVPSTWTDRTAGTSRFRLFRWLPRYLRWYLLAFRPRGKPPNPPPR